VRVAERIDMRRVASRVRGSSHEWPADVDNDLGGDAKRKRPCGALGRLRLWRPLVVALALGCGESKPSVEHSNEGSSGAPTSSSSNGDGDAAASGDAGDMGLNEGETGGGGVANGGAGQGAAGAERGGVAADDGAAGDGGGGAGGVPFGCAPNSGECPDERPEPMSACTESMAGFCAYRACTEACVCSGTLMGSESTFAWQCFPIGM